MTDLGKCFPDLFVYNSSDNYNYNERKWFDKWVHDDNRNPSYNDNMIEIVAIKSFHSLIQSSIIQIK